MTGKEHALVVTQLGNGRGGPGDPATAQACLRTLSATFHEVVAYQPAARYWTYQWYETAIYLALALILTAFSFWWLRRRLT